MNNSVSNKKDRPSGGPTKQRSDGVYQFTFEPADLILDLQLLFLDSLKPMLRDNQTALLQATDRALEFGVLFFETRETLASLFLCNHRKKLLSLIEQTTYTRAYAPNNDSTRRNFMRQALHSPVGWLPYWTHVAYTQRKDVGNWLHACYAPQQIMVPNQDE